MKKDLTGQLADITDFDLFVKDLDLDSTDELMRTSAALAALAGAIAQRKVEADSVLRRRVEPLDVSDNKRMIKNRVGSATLALRTNKSPDAIRLLELITETGLDPNKILDASTVYTINPSKIKLLVDSGILPENIIEAATKSSEVFTVRPSKYLKEEMQNTLPARLRKDFEDEPQ